MILGAGEWAEIAAEGADRGDGEAEVGGGVLHAQGRRVHDARLEEHRGRGLATEAGSAAVDWGFTEGGLERIVSIYEPENTPSGRVMERLGFTHERTTSDTPRGRTVCVMELTRGRWEDWAKGAHG